MVQLVDRRTQSERTEHGLYCAVHDTDDNNNDNDVVVVVVPFYLFVHLFAHSPFFHFIFIRRCVRANAVYGQETGKEKREQTKRFSFISSSPHREHLCVSFNKLILIGFDSFTTK